MPKSEKTIDLSQVWQDFQATLSAQKPATSSEPPPRLVKVVKKYRFAGQEHKEVVQVLETSQDAKRWPHYSEVSDSSSRKPLGSPSTTKPVDTPFPSGPNAEADIKVSVKSPPAATAASSTAPSAPQGPSFPKRKAPGPRKSKTTLAAPPAKSKKLTTLEKSALDWSKHTSSLTDAEELEAHRRGGSGYLDKVDFLNRVEERKEGVLQGSSGGKRRKL